MKRPSGGLLSFISSEVLRVLEVAGEEDIIFETVKGLNGSGTSLLSLLAAGDGKRVITPGSYDYYRNDKP